MISARQAKAIARRHPDYKEPQLDLVLRGKLTEIFEMIRDEANKGNGKMRYLLAESVGDTLTIDLCNTLVSLDYVVRRKSLGPNTSLTISWC